MHAAAVTILIERARFPPETAVAVAEAIDVAVASADLVTIPVLDARLAALRAELRAEMQEIKAELVRWVFLTMLGNVALGAGATALVNFLQRGH